MIAVEKVEACTYRVTLAGPPRTTHRVVVEDNYYQKLTGGRETPERLLERSFEFLLRREPNTSILASFDLPTINRYFPEYEREIRAGVER